MPLPINKTWRVLVYNRAGVAIPANKITVTLTPFTISATGVQTFGANVAAVAASDGSGASGGIASGAYGAGVTVDNSSNGYLGGSLLIKIDLSTVVPSVDGWLVVYLQNSTDGGTTWPPNGQGQIICPPENSRQTFSRPTAAVLSNTFVI